MTIALALIAAVPPTLVAVAGLMTAMRSNRKLGTPNGHGDLTQMVTTLLERQGGIAATLERHISDDASAIDDIMAAIGRLS